MGSIRNVSVDEMILRKSMLFVFFCIFWGRLITFGDAVCLQIFNYNLIDCLDTKVELDKRNRNFHEHTNTTDIFWMSFSVFSGNPCSLPP